jgi:predicted metal-dependent HD superfamily phosphohydrolase
MSTVAVIPVFRVDPIAKNPSTEPPASAMLDEVTRQHWRSLEGSHKPSAWDALDRGYGEASRAYHTWDHIAELLAKLDAFQALSARPALIATAVFWHDAVYATQAPDGRRRSDLENVRDSAELFRRHTLLGAEDAAAVHELIMATADHTRAAAKQEHYEGFSGDLDLFLDLDLSPLAAPWKIFAANLEHIRFEFAWLPEREFHASQIATLEGFLTADARLFRRAETRKKWLAAATDNLKFCIEALRAKLALELAERNAAASARIG